MKALLLVGSPRLAKSASESLGAYLLGQLEAHCVQTEKLYVQRALKSAETLDALVVAVAQADLVIVAAPLYVDSLPAPVIQLLEILAERLDEHARPTGQGDHESRPYFLAISNGGFPEAQHNDVALAIYRQFAHEAGFVRAGGLALGGGEAIKDRALAEAGGMTRNVVAAFDLAAAALAAGKSVPQKAQDLLAQPLMPAWMYRMMGNSGWRLQARQHDMQRQLRRRVWNT